MKRALPVTIAGEQRIAAIEDAARLRDALGVPLPIGVPTAFIEPVDDPLGDLIGRYARTHGPFTAGQAAGRFGLGVAIVHDTLRRLAHDRRITEGEFRPTATGTEWCDAEVLRRLRRLSLAALRHEVEPVEQRTYARFLPRWQHVKAGLRGIDGVASVVEQLAGARIPASAWESLVLPSRVRDYSPAMLDELMSTGEVLWSGGGTLPGNDGWLSLHLTDTAPLTLPPSTDHEPDELQREVLAALGTGGGFFFRQLADTVGSRDDDALTTALWELAWGGLITNDTLAPVRSLLGGGGAHKRAAPTPRSRLYQRGARLGYARPAGAIRGGPPTVAGRWSILPLAEQDATVRARALGETLLDRYGVVTRGAVAAEGTAGGFALAYGVLRGFEDAGRARRGYFIESLGAAQFATSGAVDRLRTFTLDRAVEPPHDAVTLAATDPANPYGAALPWPTTSSPPARPADASPRPEPAAGAHPPARPADASPRPEPAAWAQTSSGHRPGRKAGGLVVLVDGDLVLYLERGGRTVLAFADDPAVLAAAARSLADTVRAGGVHKLTIETVGGAFVLGTALGDALTDAGFTATPRGLRLRS